MRMRHLNRSGLTSKWLAASSSEGDSVERHKLGGGLIHLLVVTPDYFNFKNKEPRLVACGQLVPCLSPVGVGTRDGSVSQGASEPSVTSRGTQEPGGPPGGTK